MEVKFIEVSKIADTLPIGLYARRRVPCTLTNENTSYYNTKTDTINISFPMINKELSKISEVDEDYSVETAIRSMVYHEVSHAILTSNLLLHLCNGRSDEYIINAFEDERIETILNDFYYDVNFKKQVLMINGGNISCAKNVEQAFYNLVRFRICDKEEFLLRVEEIIKKYSNLNACSTYYEVRQYFNEVLYLFNDFRKAYNNDNNISNPSDEEQKEEIENNFKNGGKSSGKGMTEDIEGQGEKSADNSKETENENGKEVSEENGNGNSEEVKKGNCNGNGNSEEVSKEAGRGKIKDIFDKVINKNIDNNLTAELENIISQFNKKNKKGSGITAYSGVFNPRLVGNDNYRYFERSLSANGNNKFGTFHLNLYIDNSGSFSRNANRVNTLICCLKQIEKRNKNFTFDVIRCGDGMRETEKDERWITADEGTHANYKETKEIFKRHTKPNTVVHNIVLYDGYCSWIGKNPFPIFDRPNTTLIIESSNLSNVKNFSSANIVLVKSNEYCERLTEEVVKSLAKAFR